MPVAVLDIELHLPYSHSLKDKRMALRSVKERLRKHFNVSVSELDHQELWQRSRIGVASVGPDPGYLEDQLSLALEEVERILPDCNVNGRVQFLQ